MKLQSLLFSSALALTAASAVVDPSLDASTRLDPVAPVVPKSHGDRRLQTEFLDPDYIANLIEMFGEGILDSIDDAIGDWDIFQEDFEPFNELSAFLVPIVNEVLQQVIAAFWEPLDIGLDTTVEVGQFILPFEICEGTALMQIVSNPIYGLSKFKIMDLKATDQDISISFTETTFSFILVFKAGYPDGAITTGIETTLGLGLCGTEFTLESDADLILNGPTAKIQVELSGRIAPFEGVIEVRNALVQQVEVGQDNAQVFLGSDYDNESMGLESQMGDVVGEEFLEKMNEEAENTLKSEVQGKFDKVVPVKLTTKGIAR